MNRANICTRHLTLLSRALLGTDGVRSTNRAASPVRRDEFFEPLAESVSGVGIDELPELWALASSHHVILRAFPGLQRVWGSKDSATAEWIEQALVKEQARAHHALAFLSPICQALEEAGDVIVIKSLDHWPDLGSDLDLYTNAKSADVVAIMRERFHAHVAKRSWGDRLADKWNFVVPGLPELVEVHVARLGQTGEQIAIPRSLAARADTAPFGLHTFKVPAPEDRIIISTLQRMYRHFYLRLCDLVDNAKLVDCATVDYGYLKSLASSAGVWQGVATYLVIVSGYVRSYRGENLSLPAFVTDAARFGNELVHLQRNFLRIPIFPQAASLYASQWKTLLFQGDIQSTLRLSLLPGLATAAALEFRITGNDKGIW
ncbi:MAG: hypothetical protein ABSD75_04230 [Terriglobales bacterium]